MLHGNYGTTRSGRKKSPPCPHGCGGRVRVKRGPRTATPLWECVTCKARRPAEECEWTNAGMVLALIDAGVIEDES